jgi:uncharacterized protein with HEPN domain
MRDNRDNKVWLLDIIESADLVALYITDISEEDFFESKEKQDSVIRRLEIIGEAVKNLPEDFKNRYSKIPWASAAAMRNVLIHEYFDVDLDVAWDTLKNDLPKFKQQIVDLMKENQK